MCRVSLIEAHPCGWIALIPRWRLIAQQNEEERKLQEYPKLSWGSFSFSLRACLSAFHSTLRDEPVSSRRRDRPHPFLLFQARVSVCEPSSAIPQRRQKRLSSGRSAEHFICGPVYHFFWIERRSLSRLLRSQPSLEILCRCGIVTARIRCEICRQETLLSPGKISRSKKLFR
jgi:hypothetical protein